MILRPSAPDKSVVSESNGLSSRGESWVCRNEGSDDKARYRDENSRKGTCVVSSWQRRRRRHVFGESDEFALCCTNRREG